MRDMLKLCVCALMAQNILIGIGCVYIMAVCISLSVRVSDVVHVSMYT